MEASKHARTQSIAPLTAKSRRAGDPRRAPVTSTHVAVLSPMLALTQPSNYLPLKGSFSAVSRPKFAKNYALESSRRDLQNALLCTVLVGSVWVSSTFCLKIAEKFAIFFANLEFF